MPPTRGRCARRSRVSRMPSNNASQHPVDAAAAERNNPLGKTRPADPDTIMVARGSGRMIRAQVAISNTDGRTELHVTPGGLTAFGIINTLRIARMVHIVLQATLSDRPS